MKRMTGLTTIGGMVTLGGALLLLLAGCGPREADGAGAGAVAANPPAQTSPAGTGGGEASTYPGTEEGARALLAAFVQPGADHAALSQPLRPTRADLEAIFDADLAEKADATYAAAWDSGQLVVVPDAGQTEVTLASATREELKGGTGAASEFPGGWKEVAGKLKPGLRVYRFTFVGPDTDSGRSFDGLVYVNGHWRIVPKPWRAL
jgi:hypothetical protein